MDPPHRSDSGDVGAAPYDCDNDTPAAQGKTGDADDEAAAAAPWLGLTDNRTRSWSHLYCLGCRDRLNWNRPIVKLRQWH
jgi:hypothetical protein